MGVDERSTVESVGDGQLYRRDIDPEIDDLSFMANRIRNNLSSRLDGAMKAKRVFDVIAASLALILLSLIHI